MIDITYSEKDFDYELEALFVNFFPGQCFGSGKEEETLFVHFVFETYEIVILVRAGDFQIQDKVTVSGEGDFHKKPDKSAHPYRTYYKNELKRLLFRMLEGFPEERLPEGFEKQFPVWGTMTGVRPTKIPMNELLSGKEEEEVYRELRDIYCCSEEKSRLCMEIAKREASLLQTMNYENGYSLYIGIPFCPTTCLYCSFPSYPVERFGDLIPDYLNALFREIREMGEICKGKRLTSVYIGGGTPTSLSAEQLGALLGELKAHFLVSEECEFTVEAGRPDSITKEKLLVLKEHSAGRISINPQTMQQKTLDLIGRRHTVEDTKRAFSLARELGFDDINMDLIVGLPGEDVEDFLDTLEQIRRLEPDSVTIHSLVIKRASGLRELLEENKDSTRVEKSRIQTMEKSLLLAEQKLRGGGYEPYYMYRQKNSSGHFGSSGQENIGFSKPGKECLYNILIMEEMQTIIALGAGASTKRYDPEKRIVSRVENVKSIRDYISRIDEMIERKRDIF